jgi:hypothetical protein
MNNIAIETVLKILISAAAALTGWYTALKPFIKFIQEKKLKRQEAAKQIREEDKAYRKQVLDKLELLEEHILESDVSLALIQRDNIERAYCMFVVEHGYCPSGMKQAIYDMYTYYTSKGNNHIAQERIDELMQLPEFPLSSRGAR